MDIQGLTDSEVYSRVSKGEVNSAEDTVSRTYFDIITKNVFTLINLILFTLGALLVYCNEIVSAMAATGIITMNILIATVQEIKAKRRLDRIALLMRPRVTVIRNGTESEVDQSSVVKDDIICLRSGDQAPVDGVLLAARSMEMDESLLTGESNTVDKKINDMIYSGSYCITGEGYYQVTAFGKNTIAAKMLATAKKFKNKQSPLQMETGAITKLLMSIAMFYLSMLVVTNLLMGNHLGTVANLKTAVIILDMVPIGLFLMIVIAYMVAALRMVDSGILLQRSNSVESMSSVDTVCMDKTGTITTNRLIVKDVTSFVDTDTAEQNIRMFASATGSRNKTIDAILNRYGYVRTEATDEIMFSSGRKYSGVRIINDGVEMSLIMGASDSLVPYIKEPSDLEEVVRRYSSSGLRTVVLTASVDSWSCDDNGITLPPLSLVAAIAIEDEIRPDCKETMDLFIRNGVEIRILSGDDPSAVDALFSIAGLPGERKMLSGDEMDRLSDSERTRRILETTIFGRMRPDQKEMVIDELKKSGRYVAMVGDGVNDVRSLKEAQVGIALQSGSGAARGVADMVLMSDDFSALPKALTEGNKTVSGMRSILKMHITRNFVIALTVAFIAMVFHSPPFIPITSAIYAFVSLSVAGFFMIIWARPSKLEDSAIPDVLRFAIPTAILVSLFGLLLYSGFYIAEVRGIMGISFTPEQLNMFGWDGGPRGEEIVARNALLVFLTVTGLIHVLFIAPYYGFFSTDGTSHPDKKPTMLVILLLFLLTFAYFVMWQFDPLAEALCIYILPLPSYLAIIGTVIVWFFATRWVLRNGLLERWTNLTEWLYSLQLKSIRRRRNRIQ